MGCQFARLPMAVKRFHRLSGQHLLHGWVETQAPATLLARVLALCLGSPQRSTRGPIRFELKAQPDAECWVRHFPEKTMMSRLGKAGGLMEERLGATRLRFRLLATDAGLAMELQGMAFLGVPCPRWLLPTIVAREHGDEEKMHFHVSAALPWVGVVARYQGYLVLEPVLRAAPADAASPETPRSLR
jgi:hypothetical protein